MTSYTDLLHCSVISGKEAPLNQVVNFLWQLRKVLSVESDDFGQEIPAKISHWGTISPWRYLLSKNPQCSYKHSHFCFTKPHISAHLPTIFCKSPAEIYIHSFIPPPPNLLVPECLSSTAVKLDVENWHSWSLKLAKAQTATTWQLHSVCASSQLVVEEKLWSRTAYIEHQMYIFPAPALQSD